MQQSEHIASSKRIAKNAVLLYIRTFIVLCISLYISRVVLQELGVEDLGIYNLVAGIVTLVAFFQAALTKSTGRFITYEIGAQSGEERQRQTFAACLGIHAIIALIILILGEIVGLWILHHYTVIPVHRQLAANIVYQMTLVTLVVQIMRVPYEAAVIAHERMSIFATISILEALLKLVGVLSLRVICSDKMVSYALMLFLVAFTIMVIYFTITVRLYPTYRTYPHWQSKLSHSILAFCGWTMMGSATNVGTQQGVALLMNNFVNLTANAALGLANQVYSAITQFVNSFSTAFNPQVIKLYASNNEDQLHRLMTQASKLSFVLAYIVTLPLITNMDYILTLWLVDVPEYTTIFCQLILVCALFDATTGVYNTAITATGNLRGYQIAISLSFTLDLVCAWLLLVHNVRPAIVFGSRIMTRGVINMFIGLYYAKSLVHFEIVTYIRKAIIPIIVILMITIPLNHILGQYLQELPLLFISTIIDVCVITLLTYVVILDKGERQICRQTIKQKLHVR